MQPLVGTLCASENMARMRAAMLPRGPPGTAAWGCVTSAERNCRISCVWPVPGHSLCSSEATCATTHSAHATSVASSCTQTQLPLVFQVFLRFFFITKKDNLVIKIHFKCLFTCLQPYLSFLIKNLDLNICYI